MGVIIPRYLSDALNQEGGKCSDSLNGTAEFQNVTEVFVCVWFFVFVVCFLHTYG